MEFADRTIVVTGASSGLGEHFARTLAADGARVVLTARRRSKLDGIADEIIAAGGKAIALEMDVTDASSVEEGFAAFDGSIDVVINNAGINGGGPALRTPPAEFDSVVDTDLKGVFHVARQAVLRMQETGGAIVNIRVDPGPARCRRCCRL